MAAEKSKFPIQALVIADMACRWKDSYSTYPRHMLAGDGTDPLQNAYEEAMDLCMYLRKAIEERNSGQS